MPDTRRGQPELVQPTALWPMGGLQGCILASELAVVVVMALSLLLPKAQARSVPMQPGLTTDCKWVANCSVPWTPECEDITAAGLECVFPIVEAEYASSRLWFTL